MATNSHKVNRKMWDRWQGMGQAMFNRLWMDIPFDPAWNDATRRFSSKEKAKINREIANVLRHNICFMAACIATDLQDELKWNRAIRKHALKGVTV